MRAVLLLGYLRFPPAEDLQEELEMVINMQGHIYITLQDPFLVFRS